MHARLCSIAMFCKPKPAVLQFSEAPSGADFWGKKKERRKPLGASILAHSGEYHPHFEVCVVYVGVHRRMPVYSVGRFNINNPTAEIQPKLLLVSSSPR